MPDAELLGRFQSCRRYLEAKSWQKPLLGPQRFIANQLRKRGLRSLPPGSLRQAATFHLPDFTIVEGEIVSEELLSYSLFEPDLTEAFLHLVKPGQIVCDVGMHLGYYSTLFAVLAGGSGRVHSFEPTPSTREIALNNTKRFPQITVHPLALWSSAKTVTLRDYGLKYMGFNSLRQAKLDEEPAEPKQISVQAITLDQFRATLGPKDKISLIKIDAESAERDILAGGRELLRTDKPFISVEVGDCKNSVESRLLVDDFRSLDYIPWEFRNGKFARHETRHRYSYDNLIFTPDTADLSSLA